MTAALTVQVRGVDEAVVRCPACGLVLLFLDEAVAQRGRQFVAAVTGAAPTGDPAALVTAEWTADLARRAAYQRALGRVA